MDATFIVDDSRMPNIFYRYLQNLQYFTFECVPPKPKERRQPLRESFKQAIQKIHEYYKPKFTISSNSIGILSQIMQHFLQLFDKELKTMKTIRDFKTLTVKQLELAAKLCLPTLLSRKTTEKGLQAIISSKSYTGIRQTFKNYIEN